MNPLGYCSLARLLLAVGAAQLAVAAPATALRVESAREAGFSLLGPATTGVSFANSLSRERFTTNQILLNGSGVAAGDVDGDGLCDLFFCGISGQSALYHNLGGFRFTNVTEQAGVSCSGLSVTGAVLADLDGDGDLDLVVNSLGGGTHLFFNDGQGHFSRGAVLNEGKGGMSLALADYDGDGSLDLYICNYRTTTLRDLPGTNFRINLVDGKPVVASVNGESATLPKYQGRYALNASGNISEFGEVDAFYRNDGKGGFSLIPFTGGTFLDEDGKALTSPPYDWSLSVMFRDLNGDGLPDLYVCSDFDTPDRIWINQGAGKFRALSSLSLRNTSRFSMGVDVADINRDGFDDILVLDMLSRDHVTRLTRADKNMDFTPAGLVESRLQFSRNTLQLNRGDGTYAEIACFAGLEASDWSWTPIFLDVDLDGFEDLLITAGHGRDDMDIDNGLRIERARRATKMAAAAELALRKTSPPLPAAKIAFRNSGQMRFEDFSSTWGFDQTGIAHGMCLADLDNDGDLDVIVNNLNAPASIYRNEARAPRVAVRLKGAGANTRGIGARIELFGGAVPVQSQEMIAGGRYLSGDEAIRTFAAGRSGDPMRIQVTWRNGRRSVVENVQANRLYEIPETGSQLPPKAEPPPDPWFMDATAALGHSHQEDAFDDFARQALQPNRLSQLGPALAWFDVDGDGRDDLVIGASRGGAVALRHNEGKGAFTSGTLPLSSAVPRDVGGLVGCSIDGRATLLMALSNYEDSSTNGNCLSLYDSSSGRAEAAAEATASSVGALALSDLDGKGSLALFVGGRVVPGRYPEAASSLIFRCQSGRWVRDEGMSRLFQGVGMVSGAVWTDLNGDGYPDLALACEWGPVRIFLSERGRLREATALLGFQERVGRWNGVSAGDFDGDGRMDLAVSNWGLNSKYKVRAGHGPRLYWSAWGGAGEIEPIEASYDSAKQAWVPERDLNVIGRAIPWIREKFQTYRAFAQADVSLILGDRLKEASLLEVNCLETMVFLNRGDHFEAHPLPDIAQFAPSFGINVADFDGDGREDIFLSQNFFDVSAQTSRLDAGRGLLLRGKGNGDFEPVTGVVSGIKIYGQQRASAVCDFDEDGRADLAVAQNGAATTLWRNVGARPGLRVRLAGPPGNPAGVGAVMRLRCGGQWSPAREIHAGSGYWSQDSAIQVLATPFAPMEIEVIWPGGRKTKTPVPEGAREITVDAQSGSATRR